MSVRAAKILVFRIGQLGDTVISIPALRAIRTHYSGASITLLSDWHPGTNLVQARELLSGSGLVDSFEMYPLAGSVLDRLLKPFRMAQLLAILRSKKFTHLAYLAPSRRTPFAILRDIMFFRLAGIRKIVGAFPFTLFKKASLEKPLPNLAHESEFQLARLGSAGIAVPATGKADFDLGLNPNDELEVIQWLKGQKHDGGKRWVAIAPGSKMPSKRWPVDRFVAVVRRLVDEHDIWPVVFGGTEDSPSANRILEAVGRGYSAAGHLSVRAAAAALKRCKFYLGNDTGTMHLASAVGLRCAAIFSSRDFPGLWYPYGDNHAVFRSQIECEGCKLTICHERDNECLRRIQVEEVSRGCSDLMRLDGS